MGDRNEIKGRIRDKREKIHNSDRWLKQKKKVIKRTRQKYRTYEQRERERGRGG